MKLQDINWPVYRIGQLKPKLIEGVWLHIKEYLDDDTGTSTFKYLVIDDATVDAPTLGLRRLKLQESGALLFPIRRATYFLSDVIRLARATTWYIDDHGKVFQYKKDTRVKLECRKIVKILPNKNGIGSIIEVEGMPQRFKVAQSNIPQQYAGLLSVGRSHALYDLYDKPFKNTTRYV